MKGLFDSKKLSVSTVGQRIRSLVPFVILKRFFQSLKGLFLFIYFVKWDKVY